MKRGVKKKTEKNKQTAKALPQNIPNNRIEIHFTPLCPSQPTPLIFIYLIVNFPSHEQEIGEYIHWLSLSSL